MTLRAFKDKYFHSTAAMDYRTRRTSDCFFRLLGDHTSPEEAPQNPTRATTKPRAMLMVRISPPSSRVVTPQSVVRGCLAFLLAFSDNRPRVESQSHALRQTQSWNLTSYHSPPLENYRARASGAAGVGGSVRSTNVLQLRCLVANSRSFPVIIKDI
jgi:hypothetical protein